MIAWYDIVTLVILLYGTARGAQKGIVWQLAGIAALVLCFAFAEPASLVLKPYVGLKPPLDRWVSLLICYLLFSFISFGVARGFRDWIEKQRFTEYDRHVGAVFGLIKGATFSVVLTFFLVTLWEGGREPVFASVSGRAAGQILDDLNPVMPAELHAVLEPWLIRFDPDHVEKFHNGNPLHDHEHDHADGHDHDHGTPTAGGSLEQIVRDLAGSLDGTLQQEILQSLKRTDPADREELIDRLRIGIPDLMQRIAEDWRFGKPDSNSTTDSAGANRLELLEEISGIFSDWAPTRESIIADIETSLSGVPDQVAVRVLEDWRADLMEIKPDPDPQTSFSTPLDERIQRQLQLAGLPAQRR